MNLSPVTAPATCDGKRFDASMVECPGCGCWIRDGRHTRLWVTASGVETVRPAKRAPYVPAGVAPKHSNDGIRQAAERAERRAAAPAERMATPGQLDFVRDLLPFLAGNLGTDAPAVVAALGTDGKGLTFALASSLIERGTAARSAAKRAPVAAAAARSTTVTEPGLYRDGNGAIVRVERSKCGRYLNTATLVLSGKRVQLDDGTEVDGYRYATSYDRGALLRSLDAATKLDAAAVVEAGRATVCCVDCGATLRNRVSRALGIGPVCGGHGNRASALPVE